MQRVEQGINWGFIHLYHPILEIAPNIALRRSSDALMIGKMAPVPQFPDLGLVLCKQAEDSGEISVPSCHPFGHG